MNKIQLNLSIDEVNIILEGLGQMPYVQVFNLVDVIQAQAAKTLEQQSAAQEGEHESSLASVS
ncbi:MAG: hypothetical protein HRU20_13045 [Pseudomonadales bacterium]|nr:hypothetical protein [Pseudomonadales bacterium]